MPIIMVLHNNSIGWYVSLPRNSMLRLYPVLAYLKLRYAEMLTMLDICPSPVGVYRQTWISCSTKLKAPPLPSRLAWGWNGNTVHYQFCWFNKISLNYYLCHRSYKRAQGWPFLEKKMYLSFYQSYVLTFFYHLSSVRMHVFPAIL